MKTEWKKGAADRRDDRATKTEEVRPVSAPAKKDTKRWCRGKEGVEHDAKVYDDANFVAIRILACQKCGRQLAIHYPRPGKAVPEWAR